MQIKPSKIQSGFTLLEVIVALTITGFVLGGLFALAGGSKQLAWKSEQSLQSATEARAQINFALLEDDYGSVEEILINDSYRIRSTDLLTTPLRKTQPSIYSLQTYEVINDETDEIINGSRWVRFSLPR
jgi:prepilin-type N-terminal cleavage/methylation domain-containing protein